MKGFKNLSANGEESTVIESVSGNREAVAENSDISLSKSNHTHTPEENTTKLSGGLGTLHERKVINYPLHRISPARSNTLPTGDIIIKNAPNPEKTPKLNWLSILAAPVGMMIVMLVIVLIMGASSASSFLFMIPMSLISVMVAVINHRTQKKELAKSTEEVTAKYLSYLTEIENKIDEAGKKQRDILNAANPSAKTCAAMNNNSAELWSRGINSKQFMSVRLGVGKTPLCIHVKAPEKSYDRELPLEDKARSIAENAAMISDAPVVFDLRANPSMGIIGDWDCVISQAQSLIVNATAMHSYEDLKLIVVYPKEDEASWETVRWLPHVFDDKRQMRYVANKTADGKILLNELQKTIEERVALSSRTPWIQARVAPHYLVVIADTNCIKGTAIAHTLTQNNPNLSISTVFLAPDISRLPSNCQSIIETTGKQAEVYLTSAYDKRAEYVPDFIDVEQFSEYCHTMAPIRIDGAKESKDIPSFVSFLDTWKVNSPEELTIADYWKNSLPSESMAVPIGVASDGNVFFFDDHQNAHGVHGMYVGTNGSGKSSMVRSWILSMSVQFSPKFVNFVLVDFKGSGLLDGLSELPHVVGTISNLDSDIRRNLTALESEILRREAFFKETGGNIYSCYKAGNVKMPFLYIVIDELNEFKLWAYSGDDNRMKLLDRLAQVGRALGIQLIAGSQTTAPFTDTMEKNSRFRWCLKTATAEDSMYLLKTDDAFNITEKGRAIVRVGSNEVYEEVQPIFSDGPYYTPRELAAMPEREMALLNLQGVRSKVISEEFSDRPTQLAAVVAHISRVAEALHMESSRPIWPARLPAKVYLQDLESPQAGELKVTIGLVDDPKRQRQYALQIDMEKNGHVVVYGAPRIGKTTFLLSAAVSLLSHCNPNQVEVYMIGNGFKPLWVCPQVVQGADTFASKSVLVDVHKELLRRKRNGQPEADLPIVLFIDGIGEMMFEFKTELVEIAQYGPGCKIYLIASASKQSDIAPISSYLTRGYALWFADSKYEYQSVLFEKNVDRIPSKEIPGRGIFYDGRTMEFQTAIPYRENAEIASVVKEIIENNKAFTRTSSVKEKEISEVVVGAGRDSNREVTQVFREQTSLLILGDDISKREHALYKIAKQLSEQPDIFELVGVDLDERLYSQIKGMRFLQSGAEVDAYLQNMFEELKRRNNLRQNGSNKQFDKYIFVVSDWETCVRNISELSHKRFAGNVLQKGQFLGIQLIAGAAYAEFDERFKNDQIGATQLLGARCAALIDYSGQALPSGFAMQTGPLALERGDYYITAGCTEQINTQIDYLKGGD